MNMPLYLRALLLLTLIGCAWLFWEDTADTPSAPAAVRPRPPASAPDATPASAPVAVVDLFPLQTWRPPPAPVSTRPTALAPPPLPFTVSAQWRYQDQAKIVVLRGNGNQYTLCNACTVPGRIRPGGLLDRDYRLDKLTDTQVVLTYLPMKHVSTLRLDAHK